MWKVRMYMKQINILNQKFVEHESVVLYNYHTVSILMVKKSYIATDWLSTTAWPHPIHCNLQYTVQIERECV